MSNPELLVRPQHVKLGEFRETSGAGRGKRSGNFGLSVTPSEVVKSWMGRLNSAMNALNELPPDDISRPGTDYRMISVDRLPAGISASEVMVRHDQTAGSTTSSIRIQLRGFKGTDAVVTLCLDPSDNTQDDPSATIKFPYITQGKSPDSTTKGFIENVKPQAWAGLPEVVIAALDTRLRGTNGPSVSGDSPQQGKEVAILSVPERKHPLSVGEMVYYDDRAGLSLGSPDPESPEDWRTQVGEWKDKVNSGIRAVEYDHVPERSSGDDNRRHDDEKFQVGVDQNNRSFIRLTNFAGGSNTVFIRFGTDSVSVVFPWAGVEDKSKVKTRDEVEHTTANQWKRLLDHIAKMQRYADIKAQIAPSPQPPKPQYFDSDYGGRWGR